MGQHTAQLAAGGQRRSDGDQALFVVGQDAGAMAVAVDFDKRGNGVAGFAGSCCDRLSLLDGVENNREIDALFPELDHLGQLPWSNAHGIDDVPHAGGSEIFRFLEGRDRRWSLGRVHHPAGNLDRLCRLEMRAQPYAQRREPFTQATDVPIHAVGIEDEAGRFKIAQTCEAALVLRLFQDFCFVQHHALTDLSDDTLHRHLLSGN